MDNFAFEFDPYETKSEKQEFQLQIAPIQTKPPEYCELSRPVSTRVKLFPDERFSKIVSQQPHFGRKSVITVCPNCHFEVYFST